MAALWNFLAALAGAYAGLFIWLRLHRSAARIQALPLFGGLDIAGAQVIEIEIAGQGGKLWLNVDGRCRVRCFDAGRIVVMDRRRITFPVQHEEAVS